ncbi:MAG: thiamine phosphate synthase, partial [Nitrospirota bacterium]
MKKLPSGLYLITDQYIVKGLSHIQIAEKALLGGVKFIQYREKQLSKRESYKIALQLKEITKKFDATLIINDDIDIAMAVDADGVHLGQEDFPVQIARKILGNDKIIGLSTHSFKDAEEAQGSGADYIAIGPIFRSTTKDVREPLGADIIKEIRKISRLPVIAIGGINENNIEDIMKTGADGTAVISAIIAKEDITGAVKEFIRRVGDKEIM